jgi:ABC-type lipoprotein export system ATPase subunit
MTHLRFERVVKEYGELRSVVRVLDGVSVAISPGEFVAVCGRKGAGKTTMLRLAAGLEQPSAGRTLYLERDLTELKGNERMEFRAQVGALFEPMWPSRRATVLEYVSHPLRRQRMERLEAELRASEILRDVGLQGRSDHRAEGMSIGELQRAAIGRVLALRPSLLLADAPASELDPRHRRELYRRLRAISWRDGMTVVLTEREPSAVDVADRVFEIEEGRLNRLA